MALKIKLKSLDGVPEDLQQYYVEVDGEYVLDTDDGGYRDELAEFRNNNRRLHNEAKKLKEQMAKFKNIDPDKYEQALGALTELEEMKEKHLIDEGKLDEVLQQRTERMRADFDGQVTALTENLKNTAGERDQFKSRLSELLIDSTVQQAISNVAVPRKGALRDVLHRAREIWQVDENGGLVPMRDGETVFGKDGSKPLTPEEWGMALRQEAPYLFEANQGGGAGGGAGANGSDGSPGQVAWDDQGALNNNIENIAAGKVAVEG